MYKIVIMRCCQCNHWEINKTHKNKKTNFDFLCSMCEENSFEDNEVYKKEKKLKPRFTIKKTKAMKNKHNKFMINSEMIDCGNEDFDNDEDFLINFLKNVEY